MDQPRNNNQSRNPHQSVGLTVAICALNEERNIDGTVHSALAAAAAVPSLCVEILVVDDGSTDATAAIVLELARHHNSIRLVQNPSNLGLGASIRRAIDMASGEKILFIPGDNDIPLVTLELLFKNAYAAEVVMCYFHNVESRGRLRFVMSTLFMLLYTTCFDLYVQYLNGPAVYPLEKLRVLDLHSTRFSIVAEINVKLLRKGVTFIELPSNRQTGLVGSVSFSLASLLEAALVFIHVLLDVYFRDRAKYRRRPVRLPYELSLTPAVCDLPRNRFVGASALETNATSSDSGAAR